MEFWTCRFTVPEVARLLSYSLPRCFPEVQLPVPKPWLCCWTRKRIVCTFLVFSDLLWPGQSTFAFSLCLPLLCPSALPGVRCDVSAARGFPKPFMPLFCASAPLKVWIDCHQITPNSQGYRWGPPSSDHFCPVLGVHFCSCSSGLKRSQLSWFECKPLQTSMGFHLEAGSSLVNPRHQVVICVIFPSCSSIGGFLDLRSDHLLGFRVVKTFAD